MANSGAAYLAIGKPAYTTLLYAGTALVSVPLLIYGARQAGPIGAALAMTAAGAFFACANLLVLNKVIGTRLWDLAQVTLRTCAASIAMGCAVWLLQDHWLQSCSTIALILRLAELCIVGAVVLSSVQFGLGSTVDGNEEGLSSFVESVGSLAVTDGIGKLVERLEGQAGLEERTAWGNDLSFS